MNAFQRYQASLFLITSMVVFPCVALAVDPVAITPKEARGWLQWVTPLPHEIRLPQQITLPSVDVRITLANNGNDSEYSAARRTAVRQLQSLFLEKAGVDGSTGTHFQILLGICDTQGRIGKTLIPGADRLQELPHREQAYLIRPVGKKRIVLTALDDRGLFYAATTLCQLLESKFEGESVTLPLATVTDWPDIAERGQWGNSTKRDIEWLASLKMNLVEFQTTPHHHIDQQGNAIATIDQSLLRRGKRNATKVVPVISHLHELQSRGVFKAFPELRGKGAKAKYQGHHGNWAPCASNPKLIDVLAGWIRQYAKQGAHDVSCWLSESTYTCECDQCVQDGGQWVHETRAYREAWRRVEKDYPDLKIRILTTQGSYDSTEQILAELPPEVGVTYYDGHRTYDANREPMIYPLLEKAAKDGRPLGVYPTLTPAWRPVLPWSSPQFIKYRMTEFADKKLSSVVGYVVPDNRLYEFNVTASAEWSWNAHGRSEREFSLAWATRQGYSQKQAEAIADWAVMLGPVSWDIYAARLVERYFLRPDYLERYVANRSKTEFGKRFLRHIPDREALEDRIQVCQNALRLAQQSGASAIESETRVIASYYEMIDAFCHICDFISEHKEADSRQRLDLQQHMNRMGLAGVQNVDALNDWERSVMPGAGGRWFIDSVSATRDIIDGVARSLSPYGIRNPILLEMEQRIDDWTIDDFQEKREIEKTLEVTDQVKQPGTYFVKFLYSGGWNGLTIQRVALIAEPKNGKGEAIELSVDEHPGSAAAQNRRNQYAVTLKTHDPAMDYRIVARIRGSRPQDQTPGKEGCNGDIFLGANRSLDWQTRIVNIKPKLDDSDVNPTGDR